jgi:magnesium transporter
MARTRVYRNGKLDKENFPVDEISDHLKDESAVVWLDVVKPSAQDFKKIAEEFGLHALAVEDATADLERPKYGHYATHEFLNAYSVGFDPDSGDVSAHEVSAFITGRALITVRNDDGFDIDEVVKRWDDESDLARFGVDFLLYGLLDAIVDTHFDTVQAIDSALEEVEETLFEETAMSIREVQRRTFRIRRGVSHLRKLVLPMRDVLSSLMRPGDDKSLDKDMLPYYQDVYDHVLRAGEWTEALRDFVSTILETNLSVQGNRQNTVMKKVTSWAAIIAVPTAITGFYGQNIPYPGYDKVSGFITSSILIVAVSVALYAVFKRRDWL